jgi:hypothetical protein
MTDKEAMAMALDALETEVSIDWTNNDEFNASAEKMHEAITALKEALAQPEPIQSLQCFHCQATIETLNDKVMQLMAQRTWVGLTDDEFWELDKEDLSLRQFVQAIDDRLKEKNT